jgi:hypothetical protein
MRIAVATSRRAGCSAIPPHVLRADRAGEGRLWDQQRQSGKLVFHFPRIPFMSRRMSRRLADIRRKCMEINENRLQHGATCKCGPIGRTCI